MSDEPEVQQPGGLEFFMWKGQKRWKCPMTWESGDRCAFDTHDLDAMREHMTQPHTRDGKPAVTQVTSPLVDHEGKPIVREVFRDRPVTPDAQKVRFKP